MNKHVFVLEIDIQIPRHIFIIWCMRRRFSAVLPLPGSSHFSRAMYEEDPGDEVVVIPHYSLYVEYKIYVIR
jgi:hypothetical protein